MKAFGRCEYGPFGTPVWALLLWCQTHKLYAPEEEAGEVEVEVEAGAKAKPKAKGKAKAKRGRKSVLFEKCSWAEMSAHPQALTLVTRLLLTADSFHSH